MTATLRSKIQAELAWTWTDHVATWPIVDSNRLRLGVDMADGGAAQQADAIWHASGVSLADGQSAVYPLDNLPQELFGATIRIGMARVKALLIVNTSAEGAGRLLIGGGDDAWEGPFGSSGGQIELPAASPLLLANTREGWGVSANQANLRITAAGGSATYDAAILGVLAQS